MFGNAPHTAQRAFYEERQGQGSVVRRTVDPSAVVQRMISQHKRHGQKFVQPHSHYIINQWPYDRKNKAAAMMTKHVHTSINKVRTPINAVRWSNDGKRVVTGGVSGELTMWNGVQFNFESILQGHDSAVRSLEWLKNSRGELDIFISADQSGCIKYWQSNLNCVRSIAGIHKEPVKGLSLSPGDYKFATGSDDSTVRIWDFATGTEERLYTSHGWDVKCVDWHPHKSLVASGSKDNLVKLWDPRTADQELNTLHGHKNSVLGLEFSPHDEHLLLAGSRDSVIRVYDMRTMKDVHCIDYGKVFGANSQGADTSAIGYKLPPPPLLSQTLGQNREITAVTWHSQVPRVFTIGTSVGTIHSYDLHCQALPVTNSSQYTDGLNTNLPGFKSNGQLGTNDLAHESSVWSLHYHPLGNILASGGNDCLVRFWGRGKLGLNADVGDGSTTEDLLKIGMYGGRGLTGGFDNNQKGKKAQVQQRYTAPQQQQVYQRY